MTRLIIQHDLPFQLVEWDGFRELARYISSDEVQCVSSDVVAAAVMKVYMAEKEKLKNQLAGIRGKVCLSFNCWSSDSTRSYLALAAHYVDENWKLNIKLLDFFHFGDNELGRKLSNCLREWGIIEKICSFTLDVPSSDNMGWIFKKELGLCNGLLCDGEVIPIKCCAHILDRIAEEGLKVAGDVLEKIREVVKGACGKKSRLIVFSRCVEKVGGVDNSDGLHLDVSGTWKAAYMMLKSAIKYSSAFDRLHEKLFYCSNSTFEEEWGKEIEWRRALRRAGIICDLLKPFYQLTNMVSGSTYPTSNTYFKEILTIEIRLKGYKLSNDNLIRNMASKMSHEFDKYLGEHSMILAIGCVLDPRLKFRFVEDIYSAFDTNNDELVEEKLAGVRKTLYALFNKYANKCASTSSDSSTIDSGLSSPTHNKRKRESNLPALLLGYEEKVRQKHMQPERLNLICIWKNRALVVVI